MDVAIDFDSGVEALTFRVPIRPRRPPARKRHDAKPKRQWAWRPPSKKTHKAKMKLRPVPPAKSARCTELDLMRVNAKGKP